MTESADDTWLMPPKSVCDIIDATPEPSVLISPDARHLLLIDSSALPDLSNLTRPMLGLAGLRIDPQANTRFRTQYRNGIAIRPVIAASDQSPSVPVRIEIDHPDLEFEDDSEDSASRRIGRVSWSHNSHDIAFTVRHRAGTALFTASISNPTAKLCHANISEVLFNFEWMPDGEHLLLAAVPENRTMPIRPTCPLGPRIEQSSGDTSPIRTFQDLMKSPFDEQMFEHLVTTEPMIVSVDGSVLHRLPEKMYYDATCSPDGRYLLTKVLKKPFSYLHTVSSFAMDVDIVDLDGNHLAAVEQLPIADNIPIEGVRTQARQIQWMSSREATLCFVRALDDGDPNVEADFRDEILTFDAPFSKPPEALLKIQNRLWNIQYFNDPTRLVTTEYDRDRRWLTSRLHELGSVEIRNEPISRVLMDRSIRDRYGDPGQLVQQSDSRGHAAIVESGGHVFRCGNGASEEGNRPFLDTQHLSTLATNRLWQCGEDVLESVVKLYHVTEVPSETQWLTIHQSATEPPNLHLRDITAADSKVITDFRDPTPQIRGITKELVTYERSDGVQLSSTLYLPEDHQPGQRLPLLIWAYPLEFNDPATAGQVSGSEHRFTRMVGISHLTLVTQGYAVMDNATMPVVGDPEKMNDTFISQVIDSAKSAIDFAVQHGFADRDRVAVGGHSYGAFMTANLLAHSDLFRAGIARSGAYNRTLTPFGFQSERRTLWEAPESYLNISPFMHADKIRQPLLIMHGEKDNNPGTFPLQSERLYQAIKGTGGIARLVILPAESHGYEARQSVLHTQAEMIQWLNRYVKDV